MSIPARLVRDWAAAFTVSMGLVPAEAAVSVEWTVASGGNGHGSAEIDTGTGVLTRNAAKVQAKELGGYLSTPSTNAENSWLFGPAVDDASLLISDNHFCRPHCLATNATREHPLPHQDCYRGW
jgi:hypothetical protein